MVQTSTHNSNYLIYFQLRRFAHSSNNRMLGLLLICYLISTVTAQFNCSCSPLYYKMELNLQGVCPPNNVTMGPSSGISRIECTISGDGSNLTAISVTSYKITELNQALVPVKVKNVQNYNMSNDISFMSQTISDPGFVSGGLQVSMTGLNSISQSVNLDVLVQYSNLCNVPPFAFGDSIGWLKFVRGYVYIIESPVYVSCRIVLYIASRDAT